MVKNEIKVYAYEFPIFLYVWVALLGSIILLLCSSVFSNFSSNWVYGFLGIVILGPIIYLLYRSIRSNRDTYSIISEQGIAVNHKSNRTEFLWSEISKIGLQALVSKQVYHYAEAYLGISLTPSGIEKIASLNSKKSKNFLLKKDDLDEYISDTKMDLYINMENVKESDAVMLEVLEKQPTYIKKIKPLIKSKNQEEYDQIYSTYFDKQK